MLKVCSSKEKKQKLIRETRGFPARCLMQKNARRWLLAATVRRRRAIGVYTTRTALNAGFPCTIARLTLSAGFHDGHPHERWFSMPHDIRTHAGFPCLTTFSHTQVFHVSQNLHKYGFSMPHMVCPRSRHSPLGVQVYRRNRCRPRAMVYHWVCYCFPTATSGIMACLPDMIC